MSDSAPIPPVDALVAAIRRGLAANPSPNLSGWKPTIPPGVYSTPNLKTGYVALRNPDGSLLFSVYVPPGLDPVPYLEATYRDRQY